MINVKNEVTEDMSASVAQKPHVPPSDLKRVRLAGGMMLALLIVDLALYVPRFF